MTHFRRWRPRGAAAAAALASAALACSSVTPFGREVDIGRDAYVIFVGDGPGGGADLFAAPGRGGVVVQLTYSPVDEYAPALAPDGGSVAYLRRARSGAVSAWVMNLVSGAERRIELADESAVPERLAWRDDGSGVVVRTADGRYWRADAPPADPVAQAITGADTAAAAAAFRIRLGRPVFAAVVTCAGSDDLCITTGADTVPLAAGARSATAWGPDSLAYLAGDALVVRPLGAGRVRPVELPGAPPNVRDITAFGGYRGR